MHCPQDAQTWITQLQTTPCLTLAFIRVHQMALPQTVVTTCSCSLLLIYRPRKDERPSWLTYSGRFTHVSGHPSAVEIERRTAKPVKDQRCTAAPRNHQRPVYQLPYCCITVRCCAVRMQSVMSQEACPVPCVTSPAACACPDGQTVSTTVMPMPGNRTSSTSSVSGHISLGSLVCGRHRQSATASQGRRPRSRPLSGRFQNDDRMTLSADSDHGIRQAPATPVR